MSIIDDLAEHLATPPYLKLPALPDDFFDLASEALLGGLPGVPCEDTDPAVVGTYTGRLVMLEYPCAEAIDLRDIAHALAGINRYTGHGDVHYSVAQHSVLVSRLCTTHEAKRGALMHDATEAYLGDVSSALKRLLPDYRELEARWARAIAARFGVDLELAEIKWWDREICVDEMWANGPRGPWLRSRSSTWIVPWSAAEAEAAFLAEAEMLEVA